MSPPGSRPILLDGPRASLAELAHRVDGRATGHRHPLASRLAAPPLDATLAPSTGGPSTSWPADPNARWRDGDREPLVGRATDSRRTACAWRPSLRAYGLAPAETAHTPVAANVEDVPQESPRVRRVDGFLHRADPDRPRLVRGDRAVACPSLDR